MSKRRLDKLEGALGPKEAVLRWMGEAHAFASLPAYVASLIDQPETAHPFIALPTQIEKAVYEAMRRQRPGFVKEVTREAVGDTVFLLRLVIGLNVHIEEGLRVERLRHVALYWWSRALWAEGKRDKSKHTEWQRGVATLEGVLSGTERARASAEARYLDGHDCLFPELAAGWQGLRAAAELLGDELDEAAAATAEREVARVIYIARADGLEAAGQTRAADEMADRVARRSVSAGTDG